MTFYIQKVKGQLHCDMFCKKYVLAIFKMPQLKNSNLTGTQKANNRKVVILVW